MHRCSVYPWEWSSAEPRADSETLRLLPSSGHPPNPTMHLTTALSPTLMPCSRNATVAKKRRNHHKLNVGVRYRGLSSFILLLAFLYRAFFRLIFV